MFIKSNCGWYSADGQQRASGAFLVLFQREGDRAGKPELRAAVRHVRMSQCGCWMMGHVMLGGLRVGLSGSYGSDGLPCTAPAWLFDQLTPLPPEVAAEYWAGDGWNSSGKEGPTLRAWALENLSRLRRPVKPPVAVS